VARSEAPFRRQLARGSRAAALPLDHIAQIHERIDLQVPTCLHKGTPEAVRCAAAFLPANNQFLRPSTIGRSACAAPSSHYLVARGATDPDAIHQDYGLAANLMTQQVAMMAFMDLFSPAGPGAARWPAAGVFHPAFRDRQSQWRSPLEPGAARLTRSADPPVRPDRHEAPLPLARLRRRRQPRA